MDTSLFEVADGAWVRHAPLRFMGLFELGTRMTVLRAGDGLVVHSPVPITAELKAAVDALGPVRFVVAPSLYHHMFVASATDAWPDARLLAPAALRKKRPDLRIDADLEAGAPSAWDGTLELFPIRGSMLGETALYHRSSKTLVGADLFENFTHVEHGLTRGYLKLGGVYGKPGWHRLLRSVYRDRKAARASIETLLALDLENIVIAHGDIVTARARETLQEALAFLLR